MPLLPEEFWVSSSSPRHTWPKGGRPALPSSGSYPTYTLKQYRRWSGIQSRQSAKLFLQLSELGLHRPFTRRRVCTSLVVPGEGLTRWGRGGGGGGVPKRTRGQTLWYSRYICTLWSGTWPHRTQERRNTIILYLQKNNACPDHTRKKYRVGPIPPICHIYWYLKTDTCHIFP